MALYEVRKRCKIVHRRKEYYPGDTVELTDREAEHHGIRIRPVQNAPTAKPVAKEELKSPKPIEPSKGVSKDEK